MTHYISTDNNPLSQFHCWKSNLRIIEIDEVKSIPFTPISHPYVERINGTIRRECLDQTLFWNEVDLQNKLDDLPTTIIITACFPRSTDPFQQNLEQRTLQN